MKNNQTMVTINKKINKAVNNKKGLIVAILLLIIFGRRWNVYERLGPREFGENN